MIDRDRHYCLKSTYFKKKLKADRVAYTSWQSRDLHENSTDTKWKCVGAKVFHRSIIILTVYILTQNETDQTPFKTIKSELCQQEIALKSDYPLRSLQIVDKYISTNISIIIKYLYLKEVTTIIYTLHSLLSDIKLPVNNCISIGSLANSIVGMCSTLSKRWYANLHLSDLLWGSISLKHIWQTPLS